VDLGRQAKGLSVSFECKLDVYWKSGWRNLRGKMLQLSKMEGRDRRWLIRPRKSRCLQGVLLLLSQDEMQNLRSRRGCCLWRSDGNTS